MDLASEANWIAIFALVVAGLAALAATQISRLQSRLSAATIVADWLRDVRDWSCEAIAVVTTAAYAAEGAPGMESSDDAVLAQCRTSLSAIIERGRFFLPNERPQEYGTEKPPAYRGYRHPALDALVAAKRVMEGSTELQLFENRYEALVALRREFLSTMQAIIDPLSTNKQVAKVRKLAYAERTNDPTAGGLLPDGKNISPGATRLLKQASQRHVGERKKDRERPSPRPQ
jgi:hypothetical protein